MAIRPSPDADTQLTRLTVLGEPIRRLLYRFVAEQHTPITREQAAEGVGIARHVAKFHLDRLAEDGLLDTDYQRPAGRTGPGAGRPTKRYRRAQGEIVVSLPERHYDLAARILAEAVTTAQQSGVPIGDAVTAAAHRSGRRIAHSASDSILSRDPADAVGELLAANGYEPVTEPPAEGLARITLRNCPFHQLAETHTELVCGLNLDLITGLLDSHPECGLNAHLDPGPGRCCVTLTKSPETTTR